MRWERLFGDLEAQWEAEARRDLDAEVADRTRRERAAVGLYERLAAAVGTALRFGCVAGPALTGRCPTWGRTGCCSRTSTVARPWCPWRPSRPRAALGARASEAAVGKRFALGYALRGLSRDRAVVAVVDRAGAVTTGPSTRWAPTAST